MGMGMGPSKKKLPIQKALMEALLGHTEEEDLTKSEAAAIVKALIATAKDKRLGSNSVAAAKELLERAFGEVKQIDEEEQKEVVWVETKTYEKKVKKK